MKRGASQARAQMPTCQSAVRRHSLRSFSRSWRMTAVQQNQVIQPETRCIRRAAVSTAQDVGNQGTQRLSLHVHSHQPCRG